MSTVSLGGIIRQVPYRWFFIAETCQSFGLVAGATGMVIKVAAETENTALAVGVTAAPALAAIVASPLVYPLLTKAGLYRSLIGTYLAAIAGLAFAGLCLSLNAPIAIVSIFLMFLLGAVNSFHTPAVFATLGWLVGEDRVAKGISSIQLRIGISWVAGPVVGALLVGVGDGVALVAVVATCYAVALFPYVFQGNFIRGPERELFSDTSPHVEEKLIRSGVEEYQEANRCRVTQAPTPGAWGFLNLLANPINAFVAALFVVLYLFLGGLAGLIAPWLVVDLHLSMTSVGLLVMLGAVASLPGFASVDWLVARAGLTRAFDIYVLLITAATVVALGGVLWRPLAFLGVALFGLAFFPATNSLILTTMTLVFGPGNRAPSQTLYAFFRGLMSIAFVVVGLLADRIGTTQVIAALLVIGLFLFVVMRVVLRTRWNEMVSVHECESA
ncbi:MAG: hypothetical protein RJB01_1520 [Actinomycetota bacterium]|jgi:MFS family permease